MGRPIPNPCAWPQPNFCIRRSSALVSIPSAMVSRLRRCANKTMAASISRFFGFAVDVENKRAINFHTVNVQLVERIKWILRGAEIIKINVAPSLARVLTELRTGDATS